MKSVEKKRKRIKKEKLSRRSDEQSGYQYQYKWLFGLHVTSRWNVWWRTKVVDSA